MRFTNPLVGSVRIKSFYALFPYTINQETRWLERVTIKQIRVWKRFVLFDEYYWGDLGFIDN